MMNKNDHRVCHMQSPFLSPFLENGQIKSRSRPVEMEARRAGSLTILVQCYLLFLGGWTTICGCPIDSELRPGVFECNASWNDNVACPANLSSVGLFQLLDLNTYPMQFFRIEIE